MIAIEARKDKSKPIGCWNCVAFHKTFGSYGSGHWECPVTGEQIEDPYNNEEYISPNCPAVEIPEKA